MNFKKQTCYSSFVKSLTCCLILVQIKFFFTVPGMKLRVPQMRRHNSIIDVLLRDWGLAFLTT